MSRFHDPDAPVCACLACTEARYHAAAAAAQAEHERAAHLATAEAEFARRQLILPMPGLAHLAHHRAHFSPGPKGTHP